jgi:hypothetical protein
LVDFVVVDIVVNGVKVVFLSSVSLTVFEIDTSLLALGISILYI